MSPKRCPTNHNERHLAGAKGATRDHVSRKDKHRNAEKPSTKLLGGVPVSRKPTEPGAHLAEGCMTTINNGRPRGTIIGRPRPEDVAQLGKERKSTWDESIRPRAIGPQGGEKRLGHGRAA